MSRDSGSEREIERGEALRELSRAQRQLLAALAAAESGDSRERAAAAQALTHAEARLSHALAALDQLARQEPPGRGAERRRGEAREGTDWPEFVAVPESGTQPATGRRPGPTESPAPGRAITAGDVDAYVAELAELARQCAEDVDDLRSLLTASSRLEGRGEPAVGAAGGTRRPVRAGEGEPGEAASAEGGEPSQPVAEGTERASRSTEPAAKGATSSSADAADRRATLRLLARQQGDSALDDLAEGLSALESRLEAVARSGVLGRALATPAVEPEGAARQSRALAASVAERLSAIEDRLTALERRLRWLETPPESGTGG